MKASSLFLLFCVLLGSSSPLYATVSDDLGSETTTPEQVLTTERLADVHGYQDDMNRAALAARIGKDSVLIASLGLTSAFLTFPALKNLGMLPEALAWTGIKAAAYTLLVAAAGSFAADHTLSWLTASRQRALGDDEADSFEDRVNVELVDNDLISLLTPDLSTQSRLLTVP